MGWTYVARDGLGAPPRQFLCQELTGETSVFRHQVLDLALVDTVYYAAYQVTYLLDRPVRDSYPSRRAGEPFTVGLVIFTQRHHHQFGYKEVEETSGPYAWACPERILRRLSPVEDFALPGTEAFRQATQWREKCRRFADRQQLLRRLRPVLRFADPIRFTDETTYDTFVLHRVGRKVRFSPVVDGQLEGFANYRITRWQHREFDVLRPGEHPLVE